MLHGNYFKNSIQMLINMSLLEKLIIHQTRPCNKKFCVRSRRHVSSRMTLSTGLVKVKRLHFYFRIGQHCGIEVT